MAAAIADAEEHLRVALGDGSPAPAGLLEELDERGGHPPGLRRGAALLAEERRDGDSEAVGEFLEDLRRGVLGLAAFDLREVAR